MTADRVEIIRAGSGDADRLAPMFDAYRVFYGRASDLGAARAFLRDRLEGAESVVFLTLARKGESAPAPAGFAQLFPSFSSVSLCRAWILNDLYVDPAHRGRGVGRALLARAAAHCRQTGAQQLWLQTDLTNTRAQRLYDAAGMTRKEILEYTLAVGSG